MPVAVVFRCGGCDAVVDGTQYLRKRFVSVSGRDYGFGSARFEIGVDDVVPDGWMAFDPYTYATYCPKCWAEITDPKEEA